MDPLQLVELLRGHRTYIQTHNFPDPDAIALSLIHIQMCIRDRIRVVWRGKLSEGWYCICGCYNNGKSYICLLYTSNHKLLVTLEENVQSGGFGEHVLEFMNTNGDGSMEVLNIAIPDVYVEHGNVELLRKETGIDADGIIGKIIDRKAQ